MDFSTALVDTNGKLVAQGLTLPGHLGSIPTAMEYPHQTGGQPRCGLDRQRTAGEGRDQQHAVVYQSRHLLCHPLRPAPGIPNNEGVFRAIEVIAPPATIANVVLPGATAARGLTGFRMVDCCFGALAMMVPDKVFAASDGGNTGISIGGYHADRRPFIYVDFTCGTWGGRPFADGLDGNSNRFANMASTSVEITEAEYPLQILAYEFVADEAGAGQYRGGTPYRRDYRFREEEAILQVRSDRRTIRPHGLHGGHPGKPSSNILNPDREHRTLESKLTMTIRRGDVFRHEIAGAGGWGDPLKRDPEAVLKDVCNELISPGAAANEYGVVIDAPHWRVDAAATQRLRSDIRVLGQDGAVRTKKVPSSVDNYARAIIDGIGQVFQDLGCDGAGVEEVLHATTVACSQLQLSDRRIKRRRTRGDSRASRACLPVGLSCPDVPAGGLGARRSHSGFCRDARKAADNTVAGAAAE